MRDIDDYTKPIHKIIADIERETRSSKWIDRTIRIILIVLTIAALFKYVFIN